MSCEACVYASRVVLQSLDGIVQRDDRGLEKRYPVILTAEEKLIARKVSLAFKVGHFTSTCIHVLVIHICNTMYIVNSQLVMHVLTIASSHTVIAILRAHKGTSVQNSWSSPQVVLKLDTQNMSLINFPQIHIVHT